MARGTDLQDKTWIRNNKIRCLRGLYANVLWLFDKGSSQEVVLRAIDERLRWYGAEPETERRGCWRALWDSNPRLVTLAEEKKVNKPWGGREHEPSWAKELRESYTK